MMIHKIGQSIKVTFADLLKKFKLMDISATPLLMVKDAVKDIRKAFFSGGEIQILFIQLGVLSC